MKLIGNMTRLELAAFVSDAFRRNGINVVLSGGSCVSIYSKEQYVSMDLDFVNAGFAKRSDIINVMNSLNFIEENRYFKHPDTEIFIEFPPGPLGVGDEPVKQIDELITKVGILRIISPTDCVKDRLSWYYHNNDTECLEQAVLVAKQNRIDIQEIKRWSRVEGKEGVFDKIRNLLEG